MATTPNGETERVIRLVTSDMSVFEEFLAEIGTDADRYGLTVDHLGDPSPGTMGAAFASLAADLAELEPEWGEVDTTEVDWRTVLSTVELFHRAQYTSEIPATDGRGTTATHTPEPSVAVARTSRLQRRPRTGRRRDPRCRPPADGPASA